MTKILLPHHDYILIKEIEDKITTGGIELAQTSKTYLVGIVIGMGEDVPETISTGTKVAYHRWVDFYLNYTEKYHLVKYENVYGIITETN